MTDISKVFKGNKNKDVFGKSTVGLPAFYVSKSKQISRHLHVSFLLKESNGNNYFDYQSPLSLSLSFYFFVFGRMTVPLPESCCCFSPFFFLKAQDVMWCRTCVVQYLRDAVLHTCV